MWNVVLLGVPLKRWALYAGLLLAGVLSPVRPGVVWGESMEPAFRSGQPYVFTPRMHGSGGVRRGEVVLFSHDGATYVKRVLAGPGEAVYVLRYVDGVDEVVPAWKLSHLRRHSNRRYRRYLRLAKVVVPQDAMYVVGDNLSSSEDSRNFGVVPLSSVRGKVLFAPQPEEEWMNLATESFDTPS